MEERDESADVHGAETARNDELHSLHEMLEVLEKAADEDEELSLGKALDVVGKHSFAPLLLLPGIIMAAPGPADIPGAPTVLGILIIIIAIQMVMKRDHLWLPEWLQTREVESNTIKKMINWVRRPAGWLDRVTKKRWTWLVDKGGHIALAVACIVIAAATPLMEFVPFTANIAGAAIAAFGLSLMARDGLLAAVAMALSIAVFALVGYPIL